MPDPADASVDQRMALATAARRLAAEFEGALEPRTIQAVLEASYDVLAEGAAFAHFLPLMAERLAREHLRALAAAGGCIERRRRRTSRRRAGRRRGGRCSHG